MKKIILIIGALIVSHSVAGGMFCSRYFVKTAPYSTTLRPSARPFHSSQYRNCNSFKLNLTRTLPPITQSFINTTLQYLTTNNHYHEFFLSTQEETVAAQIITILHDIEMDNQNIIEICTNALIADKENALRKSRRHLAKVEEKLSHPHSFNQQSLLKAHKQSLERIIALLKEWHPPVFTNTLDILDHLVTEDPAYFDENVEMILFYAQQHNFKRVLNHMLARNDVARLLQARHQEPDQP